MKALMISGSRNRQGQTARAARAWLSGAAEAGAETETVYLPELTIERCRQCDEAGWGLCREQGRCVIKDDLAAVVEKLSAADVTCIATPVYFGDLSESVRAFTDRLRRTTVHAAGKARCEGRRVVGVCVAGGGGGGAPNCCTSFDKTLRTCGFDVFDVVPVRRQNLEMKCDMLRRAGRWAAEHPAGE